MSRSTEKDNWRSDRSVVYKNTITETCLQMECELLEFNAEDNHCHLIVSVHPKLAIAHLVGKLKGKLSYISRRNHFDKIRHCLWGKQFWSPGYCVVSTGDASLSAVKKYMQQQNALS